MQRLRLSKLDSFYLYDGDLIGLTNNDNYLVYRWCNTSCKILFSVSRKGNALTCHFASDKKGLRLLKRCFEEFYSFLILNFPWCEMFFALTKKKSVARLIIKCGFHSIAYNDKHNVLVRYRK